MLHSSCTRPVLSNSRASCATHPLFKYLLSTSVLIPSQLTVFLYVSILEPHVCGARPNFYLHAFVHDVRFPQDRLQALALDILAPEAPSNACSPGSLNTH